MTLAQKVALVTGGDSGIGRAIALRLAAEGAAVAVNFHRNQEAADEVRQQIERTGGRALAPMPLPIGAAERSGGSVPVQPGVDTVEATVHVTFALQSAAQQRSP